MSKYLNLAGQIFGRLTALKRVKYEDKSNTWWECVCSCGNKKITRAITLKNGQTTSCGCYNKEQTISRNRHPDPQYAAKNYFYIEYKKSAKARGVEFNLSGEQFFNIVSKPCVYCGVLYSRTVKPHSALAKKDPSRYYMCNGIDRVDSELGYSEVNCVTCCTTCNYAKSDTSLCDFKNWINKVYLHINSSILENNTNQRSDESLRIFNVIM